jgi:hypothetical protein
MDGRNSEAQQAQQGRDPGHVVLLIFCGVRGGQ